jgi:hypothetical protein
LCLGEFYRKIKRKIVNFMLSSRLPGESWVTVQMFYF